MRTPWIASLMVLFGTVYGTVSGSSVARADKSARSVPTEGADAKARSGLELKVVSYDGAVNGELTVEIKNSTKKAQTFSATGLYFVPEGNVDEAPQRLGAVGPMQIAEGKDEGGQGASKRVDSLAVAPGATIRVKLDVFCIDSHRSAPTSKNQFSLGSTRLPSKLRGTIEQRAKAAVDEVGGYDAPAAKMRVQSEVWGARDAAWIKLDGEGKQEVRKQEHGQADEHPQSVRPPVRIKEPLPRQQAD